MLTRDTGWAAAGAEVAHSVEAALALAGDGDIAVIGGAEVFELFRNITDRAEVTVIWRAYEGDAFFNLDQADDWVEESREDISASGDAPAFTFFTLQRPVGWTA